VQFISYVKLCIYTILHLILEELKVSQVVFKYTIITQYVLESESESKSHKRTNTPHPWPSDDRSYVTFCSRVDTLRDTAGSQQWA